MGNLSHTVGGTDNLVSFKSAARVPIDSLKVHFKPIQEGEGDPSPENVRPIKGWNEVEAYRIESDYIIEYIPGTTNSYNVTFVVDGKGGVTATGTPTSYSNCAYGIIDVEGTETIYATIYGTLNNIAWNAPVLFNSDGDRISASLSDNILNTGLDLSQFPDVKKVRLILKRSTNGVEMNGGWCAAVIGKNRKITHTIFPVTFPVTGKNLLDVTKNNRLTHPNFTFLTGVINCSSITAGNSTHVWFEQIFPAGTYTISCDYSGDGTEGPRFVCSKPIDGGTWNDYYQGYWKNFTERSCTFTAEEPFSPALIFISRPDHYNEPGTFYNIQLEFGSEATAYETYNPDNTIYGGYVDLAKGEAWSIYKIIKATWGDYNLYSSTSYNENYEHRTYVCDKIVDRTSGGFGFSNVAKKMWSDSLTSSHFYVGNYSIHMFLPTGTSNELEVDVCCKLSEPVFIGILTPVQIKALLNNNTFWSNTNDVTEVSYAIHDTAPIRAAKKRIMMASPRLETASDDLVNFNTDVAAPLKECKVYFEPVQEGEGDPSPDNIRTIKGWTSIDVYKSGKNLIHLPVMTRTIKGITWTVSEDGSIQIDGTATDNTWMAYWQNNSQHVDFYLKAGTYTLSRNGIPPVAGIYLSARDGSTTTDIGRVGRTINSITFTLKQDTLVGFQAVITPDLGEIHTTIRPQLELLSFTNYEAPNNSMIPITFPSEAGTIYGGYVDLVKGEIVRTHTSIIYDGSESGWSSYGAIERHDFCATRTINDKKIGSQTSICDKLSNVNNCYSAYQYKKGVYCDHQTNKNIYICMPDENITTLEGFKAWLVDNPIQLIYELANPIHYPIDTQTLKTFRGINNIWSTSNGPISIKYWKH